MDLGERSQNHSEVVSMILNLQMKELDLLVGKFAELIYQVVSKAFDYYCVYQQAL
jgi:hypothetical protein